MKSIGLFYFTGTQSSYYVAKALKEALANGKQQVHLYKLEKVVNGTIQVDMKHFDMIGFVLPIYGFGTPRIVNEFIEMLPRNEVKAFIIRTASSNGWINQSASLGIIHQLRRKWYDVFYDRILIVSSNWLLDFEDDVTKRLYDITVHKKIPHIVSDLNNEKRRRYKRNFIRDVLVGIIFFFEDSIGARVYGRSLYANKDCTQCGLCEKRCPVGNISFETGKFKTDWKCLWCMKCVYSCPENAIHSRGMDIVQFRNGFNYRWIIKNRRPSNRKLSVNRKLWKYMEDRKR